MFSDGGSAYSSVKITQSDGIGETFTIGNQVLESSGQTLIISLNQDDKNTPYTFTEDKYYYLMIYNLKTPNNFLDIYLNIGSFVISVGKTDSGSTGWSTTSL